MGRDGLANMNKKEQVEANNLAYRAASASSRIRAREPDPAKWGPLIAAEADDIRELVREYLKQAWRGMRHRQKAEAEHGGPVAQAEIAKLSRTLYGKDAPSG